MAMIDSSASIASEHRQAHQTPCIEHPFNLILGSGISTWHCALQNVECPEKAFEIMLQDGF